MPRRSWRLLRLVRLLVACLAFVLARPAPALGASVSPLDQIVLVASSGAEREEEDEETARAHGRASSDAPQAELVGTTLELGARQSRAVVEDKYLRNCALLR